MPRPPKPPPPRGPRSPGPPGPRPNVPPAPGPPALAFAASAFLPKPKVLLKRRFREKRPGPSAKLTGITAWPGCVAKLKQPYGVALTPVAPGVHVPNAARVLKMESWVTSNGFEGKLPAPEISLLA